MRGWRTAVVALACTTVGACTTASVANRSLPVEPPHTQPGTQAEAPNGPTDRSQTGLGSPDRPTTELTLCSSLGAVTVLLPGILQPIDGPRPLRHIPDPAEGTFAVAYDPADNLRYDFLVLDHLDGGDFPDELLSDTVQELNGWPEMVEITASGQAGSWQTLEFTEWFTNRDWTGHAWARNEVVVEVAVGIPEGRAAELQVKAAWELKELIASIDLPDPGDPVGCTEDPTLSPIGPDLS